MTYARRSNKSYAAPFLELGVKPGDWLESLVNLEALTPEELVFKDLKLDLRPTPTDEQFLSLYKQ